MKEIYEKPILVRKGKLSAVVAGSPVVNGGSAGV
ncbi:putative RiPP precursor [Mesorhizobium sp. CA15]|nr:putative RiPP precursor [Mesorhizobium sp. CA15]MBZ9869083.1 putative RiPP precursor [Mesorhizobium sp. CA15]